MLPTPIVTPKHSFKNFDEALRWAKEHIVGTYENADTGEAIIVSKSSIDKYLSEKVVSKSVNLDVHFSALQQIPRLIATAVLREVTEDKENSPCISEIQRLYGAIRYENSDYLVKLTIKVVVNEGRSVYS